MMVDQTLTHAEAQVADAPASRRLAQQLDLDGHLHDLAPQSDRMRLFEPDTQLAGETFMDTDDRTDSR